MSLHNVILQELRLLYVPAIQSQLTFIRNLLVMLPKQMEQVRSVVYTNCNGISTGMTKFVLHGLIALLSFHGLIILSPIACLNSLAPISAHHLASWSFRFRHIGIPFPIATSYSSEIALSSGHPLPRTPRYLSGNLHIDNEMIEWKLYVQHSLFRYDVKGNATPSLAFRLAKKKTSLLLPQAHRRTTVPWNTMIKSL
jgi:hypothetical protein